jgi:hypothetical protein
MPIDRQFQRKSLAGNPFRSLIASALSIAVILSTALPARASAYDGSPKLVTLADLRDHLLNRPTESEPSK